MGGGKKILLRTHGTSHGPMTLHVKFRVRANSVSGDIAVISVARKKKFKKTEERIDDRFYMSLFSSERAIKTNHLNVLSLTL